MLVLVWLLIKSSSSQYSLLYCQWPCWLRNSTARLKKDFNHNKKGLWPSSQEQSAVWLYSLSIPQSSCSLPEDFFPLIIRVNQCPDSLQIRQGFVIHGARLDLSAAVPLGVQGCRQAATLNPGAAPVLLRASVSFSRVKHSDTDLVFTTGNTEVWATEHHRAICIFSWTSRSPVLFVGKRHCCIRGFVLLTIEKLDSPARHNSQAQSHPLVPWYCGNVTLTLVSGPSCLK